jgi:hypothetical protein
MGERTLFGALALLVLAGFAIFIATRGPGRAPPAEELTFIKSMRPIMRQASQAGDLKALQAQRSGMMCRNLRSREVRSWLGTVDQIGTAPGGGEIFSVAVMPNVDFGTAPDGNAPDAGKTLLAPGSQIYQAAQALHPGQQVRFSGRLMASAEHCVQDAEPTLSSAMRNPWFLMTFTGLAPLG